VNVGEENWACIDGWGMGLRKPLRVGEARVGRCCWEGDHRPRNDGNGKMDKQK
jgi:hypothetical protein